MAHGDSNIGMSGTQSFAYHKSVAPMIWVILALSAIELLVVHFLLSFWNIWVAYVATALTFISMIWLVRFLLSMPKKPVILSPKEVVMRVGTAKELIIARSNIAGLRESWTGDDLKAKGLVNMALLAYPNIIIDLEQPIMEQRLFRSKQVNAIAHRLDDLPSFHAALNNDRTLPEDKPA
ncbi:MAG: hypothetical protein AAGH53_02570 [Pseudomonadota bacterium]